MDVRERAKLAEDERILSMTDGSHSEGRNPEALEADKARYKDSTYEIVSKVAYLIGVPKRIFENEYPKQPVSLVISRIRKTGLFLNLMIDFSSGGNLSRL